jgi:hypothetical protein
MIELTFHSELMNHNESMHGPNCTSYVQQVCNNHIIQLPTLLDNMLGHVGQSFFKPGPVNLILRDY